jgi:hypothetical protein
MGRSVERTRGTGFFQMKKIFGRELKGPAGNTEYLNTKALDSVQ